jgi:PDZ domain
VSDFRKIDLWLLGGLLVLMPLRMVSEVLERGTIRVIELAQIRTFTPRLHEVRSEPLRSGDEILSLDDQPVRRASDWNSAMRHFRVGQELRIRLRRAGEEQDVVLKSKASGWWEPLFSLLRLFPLGVWIASTRKHSHSAALWSRTAFLTGAFLTASSQWLPWAVPMVLLAQAWWIGLPTFMALSLSTKTWARNIGIALSLMFLGLTCARVLWPDYASVPPGWATTLDRTEYLTYACTNLFFWILVPALWASEEAPSPEVAKRPSTA